MVRKGREKKRIKKGRKSGEGKEKWGAKRGRGKEKEGERKIIRKGLGRQ